MPHPPLTIHVQYYAMLREQRGVREETVRTSSGSCSDLYTELKEQHALSLPMDRIKVAVNNDLVAWATALSDEDRVAFLPPVAGGNDGPVFSVSPTPIDVAALTSEMTSSSAGALVTFEGRVRDHNLERGVTRLEYEAAEEIAAGAFARIADEAQDKFDILALRCVHRTGVVQLGEVAVWIGVLAAHRGPAFEACRYTIDELKHRLPVWKKEFYAGGDSGWINAS